MASNLVDRQIVDTAKRFASEVISPGALIWERQGGLPREFFLSAGEYGLCGLLVPKKLGGLDVNKATFAQVLTELSGVCFASSFALVVHNNLASNIAVNGDHHHREVLPDMLAGRKIGAFLLTEPSVGSDAGAISTVATVAGDAIVLRGEKAWITNGAVADVLSIYAQTKPGSAAKGIANYLVNAENINCYRTEKYDIVGARAMNVCGFSFEDVSLAEDTLMIEAGYAFKVAMQGIDLARAMVAAMCCGMLKRALDEAVSYTKTRKLFNTTLADLQVPQHLLADVSTDLAAATALTNEAVGALDAGSPATIAAAHAKKFATRAALQRIADCMQMMGASGALSRYPFARHLACAKLAQYVDGTSEIQNVVLSRELFRDTKYSKMSGPSS